MKNIKNLNYNKFYKKLLNQKNLTPITCLTAYSSPIAKIIDGKVDLILVGDSLGTVLYGMKNTKKVTIEMMKNHGRAVCSESFKSLTIIDMPNKTYEKNKQALINAKDIISYTKANFVKLETDHKKINIVKFLSQNKINVVAHIGVMPQKFNDFKKIKSIGKNKKEIEYLISLSKKLEKAGAKFLLLECVNKKAAKIITSKVSIPTIGIGSSKYCDGQVLVTDDILNITYNSKKPRFIKSYVNLNKIIINVVEKFTKEVKSKKFPTTKNSYL